MTLPPGGDQNRGAVTYGAAISIIILSTTAVAARMYARVCLIHNVGWDDHTIMITQVKCGIYSPQAAIDSDSAH